MSAPRVDLDRLREVFDRPQPANPPRGQRPEASLIESNPGDTLELVRDLLALLSAATQCPSECFPWRAKGGAVRLLGLVDEALESVIEGEYLERGNHEQTIRA